MLERAPEIVPTRKTKPAIPSPIQNTGGMRAREYLTPGRTCRATGQAACQGIGRDAGRRASELFSTLLHDFALASRTVFYGMAGATVVAFVVALVGMPGGKADEEAVEAEPTPTSAGPA